MPQQMRLIDDKTVRHLGEVQWNEHWLTQDLLAILLRSRTSLNRQRTYTIIVFGTGNIETRAEDGNGNAGRSYLIVQAVMAPSTVSQSKILVKYDSIGNPRSIQVVASPSLSSYRGTWQSVCILASS